LQSTEELLEFMETLPGLRDLFATCQSGNRSEYMHVEGALVQDPDPSGPTYADPPPVLRHWQLVLNCFRY